MWRALGAVAIVLIFVVSIVSFIVDSANCNKAGGEYVRKMNGFYVCYVGGHEK